MNSNSITTPPADELLDIDELLHLAVLDAQQGHHDGAIEKLKRGLRLKPAEPRLLFMLGAEHAEVGMIDRAIEDMIAAIGGDPKLAIAHFQLGLLYLLYRNDVERARQAWQGLDQLADAAGYAAFKTGLLGLTAGDTITCINLLNRGMELNRSNPALNREMAKIRDRIQQTHSDTAAAKTNIPSDASARLMKDAYRDPAQ